MPVIKQVIPKFGLSRMKDPEFDAYTQNTITNLNGNADFPVTNPAVADLKAQYVLYHPLQAKGRKISSPEKVERDALRVEIHGMITRMGWDCSIQSNGDVAKFSKSGFDYRKDNTPYNDLLPSPEGNSVNTKKGAGRFEVKSKKLKYATNYTTRYGDPDADKKTWTKEVGPRVQMIEGATPGAKLGFQRAGNGKKGEGFFSKMIVFTVPFD